MLVQKSSSVVTDTVVLKFSAEYFLQPDPCSYDQNVMFDDDEAFCDMKTIYFLVAFFLEVDRFCTKINCCTSCAIPSHQLIRKFCQMKLINIQVNL